MLVPLATDRGYWIAAAAASRVGWQARGLGGWWNTRYAVLDTIFDHSRGQHATQRAATSPFYDFDPQYGPVIYFNVAGYDAPALNFSAPLTLAVWCRPGFTNATGTRAFGKLLSKPHTTPTSDPFALLSLGVDNANPAHWTGGISTGLGGSSVGVTSTSVLTLDTLTHVAMTYDGSNLRLYVNGVLEHTVATSLSIGTNSMALNFGCHANVTANNRWFGIIQDIRWYERVLNDAEMLQLVDPATRWDLISVPPLTPVSLAVSAPALLVQPLTIIVT